MEFAARSFTGRQQRHAICCTKINDDLVPWLCCGSCKRLQQSSKHTGEQDQHLWRAMADFSSRRKKNRYDKILASPRGHRQEDARAAPRRSARARWMRGGPTLGRTGARQACVRWARGRGLRPASCSRMCLRLDISHTASWSRRRTPHTKVATYLWSTNDVQRHMSSIKHITAKTLVNETLSSTVIIYHYPLPLSLSLRA